MQWITRDTILKIHDIDIDDCGKIPIKTDEVKERASALEDVINHLHRFPSDDGLITKSGGKRNLHTFTSNCQILYEVNLWIKMKYVWISNSCGNGFSLFAEDLVRVVVRVGNCQDN
jgi:hypothetical protein